MEQEQPKDWHDMMLATYTMVGELQKRIDKHSCEYNDNFKTVFCKLDEMKDTQHHDKEELLKKIQEVELSAAKSEGALNTKLAVVNGSVSLIVSAAMTFVMGKLRGGS